MRRHHVLVRDLDREISIGDTCPECAPEAG
jgi:hypothetical protein